MATFAWSLSRPVSVHSRRCNVVGVRSYVLNPEDGSYAAIRLGISLLIKPCTLPDLASTHASIPGCRRP